MVDDTKLIINLCSKYPKESVLEFMDIKQEIDNLQKDKQVVIEKVSEALKAAEKEINSLKSSCIHPHTYLTGGGQYEKQVQICSICGSELE